MASSNTPSRPINPDASGRPGRAAAKAAQVRRGRLVAAGTMIAVFTLFGAIVWYAWLESGALGDGQVPLLKASREPWKLPPTEPGGLPLPNAERPIGALLEAEAAPATPERIVPVEEIDVRALAELPADEAETAPAENAAGEGGSGAQMAQAETAGEPRSLLAGSADPTASGAAGVAPADEASPGLRPGSDALEPAAGRDALDDAADQAKAQLLPPQPITPQQEPAGPPPAAASPAGPPTSPVTAPDPGSSLPVVPPNAALEPAMAEQSPPKSDLGQSPEPASETVARPEPPAGPAAAVVPAATPPALAASGVLVQLAAVSQREGIEVRWKDMQRRWPQALAGRQLKVEPLQRGGRTLWRIQAAGYANRAEAEAACRTIRKAGGDCFVVSR